MGNQEYDKELMTKAMIELRLWAHNMHIDPWSFHYGIALCYFMNIEAGISKGILRSNFDELEEKVKVEVQQYLKDHPEWY